jgi:hypothetical protein
MNRRRQLLREYAEQTERNAEARQRSRAARPKPKVSAPPPLERWKHSGLRTRGASGHPWESTFRNWSVHYEPEAGYHVPGAPPSSLGWGVRFVTKAGHTLRVWVGRYDEVPGAIQRVLAWAERE